MNDKSIIQRFDFIGFISNITAVILGIVITFSIQGLLDKRQKQSEVKSALMLVKDELNACKGDLESCADFMDKEAESAKYILKNFDRLHQCPQDTVAEYGTVLLSEMLLTLPDDALELLKTSSLFPAIGDNAMSLKLIRAYDQCNALLQVFNRSEKMKIELFAKAMEQVGTGMDITNISLVKLGKSYSGHRAYDIMSAVHGDIIRKGIKDIDTAIDAIEKYLN